MAEKQLPIETRSLRIRHFVLEDAAAVLVLSNEQTYRTWLPSQVYEDFPHAHSVLEFLIAPYLAPANPKHSPYVLAIEHRTDGALLGHVGFSPLEGEVEIGFSIAQDYQRQGFATEAIVAVSHWAFEIVGLDRILGITSATNVASRRTLLRAGFTHVGDKTMNFQGAEQDVNVYVLVRNAGNDSGA